MNKNLSNLAKKSNSKKGFTLIELIVVIAILAILAAIALPRLTGAQDTARTSTHNANITTLKSAANIAVAQNGSPSKEITWTSVSATATDPAGYESNKYLDTWPSSPWTSGTPYSVKIATDGTVTVTGGTK